MIENQLSEGVHVESIERKKKKRKHDKSSDSDHKKNNDVSSDSINTFLINMFSDGSTEDWSVRNKKKKKKHLEPELGNELQESKRRHNEIKNNDFLVTNVETRNNMTEFFQKDSIATVTTEKKSSKKNHSFDIENTEIYTQSNNNSFNDEELMVNRQEFTPKKSKKIKLEVQTPETEANRKQRQSAGNETVFKKKDKHKVTDNFTENEERQKRKHSVGDENTETYNGNEQCDKNNFFDASTPKKSKQMKLEMKSPDSIFENIANHKISSNEIQSENEVKQKKKTNKHKSDNRSRHTSVYSTTENTCSNSEDGIPSKKKKKIKDEELEVPFQENKIKKKKKKDKSKSENRIRHTSMSSTSSSENGIPTKKKKQNKDEAPKVPSHEEVNDVPQIKKKKKKKSENRSRHTSMSSTSENTCSNSEDGIPSKKKKRHKDEVSMVQSEEELYDVPQIKKKKKKKDKENIYKPLPIKIRMKETDRLVEDNYMSSDYSMNNENVDSSAVLNTPKKEEYIHNLNSSQKFKELSPDLFSKAEEQRESSHEVARPESVSSPDTFTIEVQEDRGSTLNGSFSPNDNKKIPTISVNKELKKKCFHEPPEEKDYDSIIAERLDEIDEKSTLGENRFRLGRLYILISWTVPQLHLIETRVSTRPSPEQKAQINSLGVKVKTGIFTKQEDDLIRRNFKDFCKEHDFPEDPTLFLNFVHEQEVLLPHLERMKFVRYLARDLNNRLLSSVYRRFRILFRESEMKTGRFSDEEDKIIMHYITTNTKSQTPFADLGRILKREKLAVEKRYKKLTTPSSEGIQWTKDRIDEFLKVLVEVTGCGSTEGLKNWEITPADWTQVSSSLKVSVPKLRYAWLYTIYPKVFTPEKTNTDEIKIRLINLLRDKKERDWRSLNWDELAQDFEGFTGASLYRMMKNTVCTHVPPEKRADLRRCMKYLYKNLSASLKRRGRLLKLNISQKGLNKLHER